MTATSAHPRRRSELGVDTIGWLRQQLTGLGGFATMLFELVQNAEDEACGSLDLEFTHDALVVRNPSTFSDKDWDRITQLASGGKAFEDKPKIGTFGIGFISVYQITDCPEIVSAGEHAIFRPERQRTDEGKSIEWPNADASIIGTEFRLPWARTRTRLREWLEQPVVGDADIERFWNEAIEALPDALIFLSALNTIHLQRGGEHVTIKRDDGDAINKLTPRTIRTIRGSEEIRQSRWFTAETLLPRPENTPTVRSDREPKIALAVADATQLDDFAGRLFCFLPTQHETRVRFHIHGTFFAKSDRKGIERDGANEHVIWNHALLGGVPSLLTEIAPPLFDRLGFKRFYELLPPDDFKSRDFPELDAIKDVFINAAKAHPIIPDRAGTAHSSTEICFGDQLTDEELKVFESLGANFVHPDISASRNWLAKFGVQPFTLAHFRDLPVVVELADGTGVHHAPEAIRDPDRRAVLFGALAKLLARPKQAGGDGILKSIPLAITRANTLRPLASVWTADAESQDLFAASAGEAEFLSVQCAAGLPPAIYALAPAFSMSNALSEVEEWSAEQIAEHRAADPAFLSRLYRYFQRRKTDVLAGHKTKVKKLPIFLATDGQLHELSEVSLPGQFDDPLRLGITIDLETIFQPLDPDDRTELRRFFEDLGVQPLSLHTYCTQHVKRYFDELDHEAGADWPPTAIAILDLLRAQLRGYQDDDDVRRTLGGCTMVPASTGEFEFPGAVYLPSETLNAVFGQGEYDCIAHEMPEGVTPSWREFYDVIGVKLRPTVQDVVQRIRKTAGEEYSGHRNSRLRTLFSFLNEQFETLSASDRELIAKLRELPWLPKFGEEQRLRKPSELFTRARRYLFETQAEFIAFDEPSPGFREQLGLRTEPAVNLVVQHLLECAGKGVPVNREVYRFLSLHSDDRALGNLRGKPCIDVGGGKYSVGTHVFFDQVPFGKYRFSLSPDLQEFRTFFEAVGVRPVSQLGAGDYAGVLSDVCDDFADGRPVDDAAFNVVVTIYQWAHAQLERDQPVAPAFSSLTQSQCVVASDKRLRVPSYVVIADKSYLADIFRAALKDRLIPKDRNTWRALRDCLRVRTLSECVRADITAREGEAVDQELTLLLRSRRPLFQRVIETRKREYPAGWNDSVLDALEVRRLARLEAKYTLDGDVGVSTDTQKIAAWYDKALPAILVTGTSSNFPRIKVARELAIAVNEDLDPSQLVPLFERILAEDDLNAINEYLDEAGIDRLTDFGQARAEASAVVTEVGTVAGEEGQAGKGAEAVAQAETKQANASGEQQSQSSATTMESEQSTAATDVSEAGASDDGRERSERTGERGTADSGAPGGGQPKRKQQEQQDKQRGGSIERRSYVRVRLGSRLRNPDDALVNRERRRIEITAENLVIEHEKSHDRTATKPTDPDCGYDFDSVGAGEQRCIEVKGLNETWDGFQVMMTSNEFRAAWDLRDKYFLYVVDKIATGRPRLQIVQNPAHSGDYYAFDNPDENVRFDEDGEEV